jgi:hypothetical protein
MERFDLNHRFPSLIRNQAAHEEEASTNYPGGSEIGFAGVHVCSGFEVSD